ncbi:hypothetical protein LXA43DRAFT_665861 [Ganoderma leucocontextum]|nr:hypothetical protein LXA43DRAFT_665861 [Ganoderma leucocontextum]
MLIWQRANAVYSAGHCACRAHDNRTSPPCRYVNLGQRSSSLAQRADALSVTANVSGFFRAVMPGLHAGYAFWWSVTTVHRPLRRAWHSQKWLGKDSLSKRYTSKPLSTLYQHLFVYRCCRRLRSRSIRQPANPGLPGVKQPRCPSHCPAGDRFKWEVRCCPGRHSRSASTIWSYWILCLHGTNSTPSILCTTHPQLNRTYSI